MRVQHRRAVRTHDPEVLETMIVSDAVDVVEDQGHPAAAPFLPCPHSSQRRSLSPVSNSRCLSWER
jgi:hypothetical protein